MQPQNRLKIDKNAYFDYISTELCHKNSMLGSQNGPLRFLLHQQAVKSS